MLDRFFCGARNTCSGLKSCLGGWGVGDLENRHCTYYPYFATGATLGKEQETKVRWKKNLWVIEKKISFFSQHTAGIESITPCKQVPPPVFFQFFHYPHCRSPIQFKKIRSATRSELSAQGRGIQRSHYTTLWDSAQAIS